jgi:two-component system phosphate regulon sensor histidine kinase PhoR
VRIRHKLLVILVATALAGSLLVGLGSVWLLREATREHYAGRIRAETALLAEWVRTGGDDYQALAVEAGKRLGVRITLIGPDGVVLGDSARDRAGVREMENHIGRPEIRAALSRGLGESVRTSGTTNEEYFYSARLVGRDEPVGFVRIALPSNRLDEMQARYARLVTGIVLVALLLLTGVAYAAVRRVSKPVERMSELADRTARGDLGVEVPDAGVDEVSRLGASVNRMKRALVEKIGELEDERALFSSVIGGMREGLLVVGPDRRIRLANPALARIFDLREDPSGHRLAEVVRHPTVVRAVEAVIGAGDESGESIIHTSSGDAFELHVTRLSTKGTAGGHGVLVLFFDITRLEALEAVRRDFVANVSHELRTPLTAIKAFVETLLDGGLSNRKRSIEFLEITRKHVERMEALIDDLTDLSLIETGAISLEIEPVDANEVADDVFEQLGPRAASAGVELHSHLPSPFPVRADRRRLGQVLSNLVDNAIKFNRKGGEVRIGGRIENSRRILQVEDNGVGIPLEAREKIFHRFYRVDPDRSRAAGGTGLGLAIVKHLMRLQGGSIRVESEVGVGTRFELNLPAPESETEAA